MKSEILAQLKSLCEAENLSQVQGEVKALSKKFNSILNQEQKALEEKQLDLDSEIEIDEENEQLNREIKALLEEFFERKKEEDKERKAEENVNLAIKQTLIKELQKLIENEENIGKAFEQINDIRTRWKETGDIPQEKHHDLQTEYSRLNDLFNYNISIYKELKELDLKKNYSLKNEVIFKLEQLLNNDSGVELQKQYRILQQEWEEIGGTYKEHWEDLKEKYWDLVKQIQEKVQVFFNELKEKEADNLLKKKALIEDIKEKTSAIPDTLKDWEDLTKIVVSAQENWKKIGNVPRSENKSIWKEFREVCNQFFEKKSDFYKSQREVYNENGEKKKHLIEKAEELKNSTDWQKASNEFVKLQKEWSKIGHAGKFAEQRLWKKFRETNDFFFNAKKSHFKQQDNANQENVTKKETLIEKLKDLKLPKEPAEAAKIIQSIRDEFFNIQPVPVKDKIRLQKDFETIYKEKFTSIGVTQEEIEELSFETRLENLTAHPNAENIIIEERQKIRKKIEFLQADLTKLENNMSFFNLSKGAEKLLSGVKNQAEEAKRAIEAQKSKLKRLNIAMNELKKQQSETEVTESKED
jgi:hypothetical protein